MSDIRAFIDAEQWAESRQKNMGRLFLRAARAFSLNATEKLHARGHRGLSVAHATLLAYLDLDGTHISVLAERAGMTKQSMGQLVRELEQHGYVARQGDPADRRATLVIFTEAGYRLLLDTWTIKREIEDEYAALLGAERLEELRAALNILIAHAESVSREAVPPRRL